ncbi:hypothetical protein SH467x_000402 [Pirellulaceae bacterium SH467]
MKSAAVASRGAIRNTAIGCSVGLAIVVIGLGVSWSMMHVWNWLDGSEGSRKL